MKIQNTSQLLHLPVFGPSGERIGTVVALRCTPDPYTPAWVLVRLRGLRQRLRAVPVGDATWRQQRRGVVVPYAAGQVAASPPATESALDDAVWCRRTTVFYHRP